MFIYLHSINLFSVLKTSPNSNTNDLPDDQPNGFEAVHPPTPEIGIVI